MMNFLESPQILELTNPMMQCMFTSQMCADHCQMTSLCIQRISCLLWHAIDTQDPFTPGICQLGCGPDIGTLNIDHNWQSINHKAIVGPQILLFLKTSGATEFAARKGLKCMLLHAYMGIIHFRPLKGIVPESQIMLNLQQSWITFKVSQLLKKKKQWEYYKIIFFMVYLYKNEKNGQIKNLKKKKVKKKVSAEIQTADLLITRQSP